MIVSLIVILALACLKIRFNVCGFFDDYLDKDRTQAIKGVFIGWVFVSHINGYIKTSGYQYTFIGDDLFMYALSLMGQLCVVMFLFYSGYGVGTSIARGGGGYVKAIPRRRILTTLLNFDIAVLVFIVYNLAVGKPIIIKQSLLSLVAWDSVGNSNWYIFAIIFCYFAAWVSGWLGRYSWLGVSILCGTYMLVMSCVKGSWWYDTIMAFALGYMYSVYKDKIESILKRGYWWFVAICLVFLLALIKLPINAHGLRGNTLACVFALFILLITMKVQVNNRVLNWMGANLFPLYIYQRLPMLLLLFIFGKPFVAHHPLSYIIMSGVITVIIAYAYRFWKVRID